MLGNDCEALALLSPRDRATLGYMVAVSARRRVLRRLVQQAVRERLQRTGSRWADRGAYRRRHGVRARTPLVGVEEVEARVRGDSVEPRADRRADLEALARAPRAQERLLDEVLGLVERAEHPVAVNARLGAMALGQLRERRLVGQLVPHRGSITRPASMFAFGRRRPPGQGQARFRAEVRRFPLRPEFVAEGLSGTVRV